MMKTITCGIGFILIVALAYGLWSAGKWVNYKFAYESGVKTTITEMVKSECLK